MAGQLNVSAESTKPNARSTTMLVHELPSGQELYESFVWDPEDTLVFGSESEDKESEMDLSFLYEDSSPGEEHSTDSGAPEPPDPLDDDDKATALIGNQRVDDDDDKRSTKSSSSTSSYHTNPMQHMLDVNSIEPAPIASGASSPTSDSSQLDVEYEPPMQRVTSSLVEYNPLTSHRMSVANAIETEQKRQGPQSAQSPISSMHIANQFMQEEKANTAYTTEKQAAASVSIPASVSTKETVKEGKGIEAEADKEYNPVKLCVTNFKRSSRKPKQSEALSPLSAEKKQRMIRKASRATPGTIPCPKIPDTVINEADGSRQTISVRLMHLFVRVRTHHKLNNYKNMSYASRSCKVTPQAALVVLDAQKIEKGCCEIEGGVYAFVKKNVGTQKEYKMVLRTTSNDKDHATLLLNFIEAKLDESLDMVKKITKFDHDACIHSVMTEMNK